MRRRHPLTKSTAVSLPNQHLKFSPSLPTLRLHAIRLSNQQEDCKVMRDSLSHRRSPAEISADSITSF